MFPAPPNYNSPVTQSAWWIERTSPTAPSNIVSTTGYSFVRRLKSSLSEYFSALSARYAPNDRYNEVDLNTFAYAGGRGDVPEQRFVWTQMGTDAIWNAATNAALWRWLQNQRTAVGTPQDSSTQHAIQYHLDQIERVVAERSVNFEALRVAIFAARHRTMPITQAFAVIEPASPATINQIMPPPYNRPAPPPENLLEDGIFHTNLEAGPLPQPAPRQTAGSVLVPAVIATTLAAGFIWLSSRKR